MQFPRELLATLDAVAATGSFEAAADAIHVTPSAISQRVRGFERALGRVLVVRSRPVRLTDDGSAILRLARQVAILEHETAAQLGLADDDTPGTVGRAGGRGSRPLVPIAVNADSLATWLLPPIAAGADLAGAVVELHRDDQDHTQELLAAGTVVAAVASRAAPVSGCVVRPLGTMTYRPMAAPAFAARWFPGGVDADALAVAPVIDFDRKDDLQTIALRRMAAGRRLDPPRSYVPASADYLLAAQLGLGWAMIPDVQAAPARASGALIDLAPAASVDVALHWHQWDLRSRVLDTIADAVVAAARLALTRS